jgi:hypothetical protein
MKVNRAIRNAIFVDWKDIKNNIWVGILNLFFSQFWVDFNFSGLLCILCWTGIDRIQNQTKPKWKPNWMSGHFLEIKHKDHFFHLEFESFGTFGIIWNNTGIVEKSGGEYLNRWTEWHYSPMALLCGNNLRMKKKGWSRKHTWKIALWGKFKNIFYLIFRLCIQTHLIIKIQSINVANDSRVFHCHQRCLSWWLELERKFFTNSRFSMLVMWKSGLVRVENSWDWDRRREISKQKDGKGKSPG